MYSREIQPPRASPIENGKPIAGTWKHSFEKVDLLDIRHPFGKPYPKVLKDSRIKEWQSFVVQDERFCLTALLSNIKCYRWAQVCLLDKEGKEKLWFRKILPFSGWKLPQTLSNAFIDSRSYGFFFRIHDWLDADTIKIDLDVEATQKRPSFTAHLEYEANEEKLDPMVVNLLFSEERSMYAYKLLCPVRGDMVFGGKHISLNSAKTVGIFCDNKGYYPYRMRTTWCSGVGFHKDMLFGFSIAENQAKETFKNNENGLWKNGCLTYLPPVRITQPNGLGADWIIQDMEGMVDLVFTPKEHICNESNLFFTNVEYNTLLGYYNGMLITADGEQSPVHHLWGLGEKLYLRV
ncbi:MAG: DUF2804 domain-containing protein [Treponema sp.]|nr:DUF2804 domain-containing protein [Treponema sp.]